MYYGRAWSEGQAAARATCHRALQSPWGVRRGRKEDLASNPTWVGFVPKTLRFESSFHRIPLRELGKPSSPPRALSSLFMEQSILTSKVVARGSKVSHHSPPLSPETLTRG